jgi:putative ABC transport system permease protein
VTVTGIYKDDTLMQNGMITQQLVHRLTDVSGVGFVLATVTPGSDPEKVAKLADDRLTSQFPTAKLQSNAEFKKSIADQVNTLLALIYALLGVSVLISLFGIVNTLLLSVYERTREIGMLRAIGMTRRQLRRTIRFESAITAVIGSLLGLVIGVLFGWIVTEGLSSQGLVFAIPWGTLIACLVVAAFVGVLAGAWPAWRASRMRVLDALSYE